MKTLDDLINEAAREVIQHCENAMQDFGEVSLDFMEGKYAIKVANLREDGMKDAVIADIIASDMYEDWEILHDLAGDHIFDSAICLKNKIKGDESEIRKLIICAVKMNCNHKPMVKAMDELLKKE